MSGVRAPKRGLMSGPSASPVHPTDPFSPSQLLVIEEALCEAWRRVVASTVPVATAGEVELNAALVTSLHELLAEESVSAFTSAAFESPVRGGEVEDRTGACKEKRPDVCLRPIGNPGHSKELWALFIECKIVDGQHPVSNYLSKGLRRFIDGTYAWAVRHGMMLAYVRDGDDLHARVGELLTKKQKAWAWRPPAQVPPGSTCTETVHERAKSDPIAVRHLALVG